MTTDPQTVATKPETADPMHESARPVYTALHGSLAVCFYCGKHFTPRIRSGPNADRFCEPRHKDAWHNERRAKERPLTASERSLIVIVHRGVVLALTPETYAEARRLGREITASQPPAAANGYLSISEVTERVGYCRASVYSLMDRGRFPRPVVLSAPGKPRKVRWRETDVAKWLER
jgi:prophage regulatory protein